ncbi:J domain-containing protein [Crenalkalicoccus roseus]|uniref:molecular chaperone DnaJ n=1 Tax=Crenalkalicoccus roseus TaxID=1485588 RepID=UPI00108012B3|nr:molecular chaperone DnaJ [Crenalkalicoccus roseus]
MVWIALGAAALLLVLWLGSLFATARVETVKKAAAWTAGLLGASLLVVTLATGRGAQALWTLLLFGPLLWRLVQSWHAARQFGRQPGASGGGETAVETATLLMRLDHATGRMSGRVRRGRFAGRELAELDLEELLSLLAGCRADDPESVPLLEAWLDRVAPDWREAEAFSGGGDRAAGRRPAGGRMTREEALAVLGLREGATPEEIRAAHRRLMRSAHPDSGGSDWLAARINEARDVLLG